MTDNELIAEFMGWKIDNSFPDKDHVYRLGNRIETKNAFKFSTSWDALMPVVEKITQIARKLGQQAWVDTAYHLLNADINIVYNSVVDFIKWYNQNNQS